MLKKNKKNKQQDRHRWLLIGFLCLFGVCLVAQVRPTGQKPTAGASTKSTADTSKTAPKTKTPAGNKKQSDNKKQPENKKTKVYLLHADEGQADKLARPDVQVLIGNVKLRHDSMYMYCDSALIFEKTNSVEAFSNVRMEQGDTLFIYGDYLYYDGMTQIAQLRENVKMINRNTTLLTDSFSVGCQYCSRCVFDKNRRVFTSVIAYSGILSCGYASGNIGNDRIGVHIDKIQSGFTAPTA